ncbi:MAG: DNA gyrase subunit A [Gammaproteobacteria bacterium]|nr:MAG: DNA gyrase subunit A [Gammaproteobacteria bacterium]
MADTPIAKEILRVNIEQEMKQSYMEYAMSVIIGRALPDVRDGLKPVHRRVLYAMYELGNDWNKPYKKSSRIVGDVIGKYHPHGDSAVYDTIVRMAQPFSLRYMLVDGQGNFGSIDGDAPAAMRYTEVRMSKIAHQLLADIDKDTVEFRPNYDESEQEPCVLPARIPNLLVNGSSGIAVGLATNIPPHNLNEVINACIATLEDPDIAIEELMHYLPGPDFPTAAIINGAEGIRQAYLTGKGRIYLRARASFEEMGDSGKFRIVVTELPYQVNKAHLLEKIAELVKSKKLEGITELRDESDKEGMRMVIELRRGESPEVILNNLYRNTQLQNVFGMNMVALVDGRPKLLNLKQMIEAFLQHRREVITRRTLFDLRKARHRAHVLEGLLVAISNIDAVIALIKASPDPATARQELLQKTWPLGDVGDFLSSIDYDLTRPDEAVEDEGLSEAGYRLSAVQAQAILDLRLHRLTGLEKDKIIQEYQALQQTIRELLDILSSPERLNQVIREELESEKDEFGDSRKTEILSERLNMDLADLINKENLVVTLSHQGYVKSQTLSSYQAQRRGGRGKSATQVKEEDFVERLFVAHSHDTVLCFSSLGKLYWLKVYELPQATRHSRGKPIVNLLPLQENERINTILPVHRFTDDQYVFMATAKGTVKKTSLKLFSRPRASGIRAIELREDDYLVGAFLTDGRRHVMLVTSGGKAVRFNESEVRAMGRSASGVRGVSLGKNERVISLIVVEEGEILVATENGYGKRTPLSEFPEHRRGGKGVIAIQTSERNGDVVAAAQVNEGDELMLISTAGTLIRTRAAEVSIVGRNTQGVRLVNLSKGERLIGLAPIDEEAVKTEGQVVVETADTDSATQQ